MIQHLDLGRKITFAAAAVLLGVSCFSSSQAAERNTIDVAKGDPDMAAAIAKARATLDGFWSALENPKTNEEGFSVKAGIRAPDRTEHMWLTDVRRLPNGRIYGRYANQPEFISARKGDAVEVAEKQISDWMLVRDGKWVGVETMRPLIRRMPKDLADQYRSRFETP